MAFDNPDDNCWKEYDYACKHKGVANILPIVMKPDMTDVKKWKGTLQPLASILHVRLTGKTISAVNVVSLCQLLSRHYGVTAAASVTDASSHSANAQRGVKMSMSQF